MLAKLIRTLLISAILGCSGGRSDDATSDPEVDELALAGIEAGLYHLPNRPDATSLALYPNQSFRWIAQDCTDMDGDFGRWALEDGRVVLYPRSGRATLRWPSADAVLAQARIELRVQSEASTLVMEISDASGVVAQAWQPGGVCPQCDAQGADTGQQACADPLHDQVSAGVSYGGY